jgi:ketosteroid isomerase-like protein
MQNLGRSGGRADLGPVAAHPGAADTERAMSQENVEIVRRAWEAATSKPPNWSVVSALYDPDHVLESDWGGVNNTAYSGARGFEESIAEQDDAWDEWRHELRDLIDAGGDLVVAEGRLVARGKHSAIPVDEPFGAVITLRAGRIIRTRAYVSVEDALRAAGLRE